MRSYGVAARIIHQVAYANVWPNPNDEIDHLITASTAMKEIAPQTFTEAMLAAQMLATNEATAMFLWRATRDGQSPEVTDASVLRATRVVRLFVEQLDVMAKLKGNAGQQEFTVEHVHVHKGGQAIVGAVSTTMSEGGGGQ
jgi:hypothetical protein